MTSLMIFLVAVVATAAATTGPTYYTSAQTSILQDTVAGALTTGRGIEVVQAGSVSGTMAPLAAQVNASLAAGLGGQATADRLFAPPIDALEATAFAPGPLAEQVPLVWRRGVCAHLTITKGTCPSAAGEVMISTSLARINSWPVGQKLVLAAWSPFTVTGLYQPPTGNDDYFYDRATVYFPYEKAMASIDSSDIDAMFTPQATLEAAPAAAQGNVVVQRLLAGPRLLGSDLPLLSRGITALVGDPSYNAEQATVTSEIPATLGTVRSGWRLLAVPVVLITAQLLVLAWLLLFLVVTDAVDGRGPEIALAKLRGHSWWRTTSFGLSEPALLIALALPTGVLAGWTVTAVLAGHLLRPGTPVGLPVLGWAAAAGATAGGLAAVVVAARRTLSRPVVEQWRRAGRRSTDRGWVLDGILLAGAVAGLLELAVTGQVSSPGNRVLSLMVPGLLGLAVAVVASRLLPVACRAAARAGRNFKGLGAYLALRHVARRPGGVRTTILLATAFSLATFATAAWLVGQANYRSVANAQVGAPTVLTVTIPEGGDLSTIVTAADPTGRRAAAVETYTSQPQTLAVDPARFARVAAWAPGSPFSSPAALARAIAPSELRAITLTGDAMRLTVTVGALNPPGDLVADVFSNQGTAPTPVDLGVVPAGGTVLVTGSLAGCPCTLEDFAFNNPSPGLSRTQVSGSVTLSDLQNEQGQSWIPVEAGFSDPSRWRSGAADRPPDTLVANPAGLRWTFVSRAAVNPSIQSVNRPNPLPALVAAPLVQGKLGPLTGIGLDGRSVTMTAVAMVPATPGAPADGVIVDRRYTELATGNLSGVTRQVWLAAGDHTAVLNRLHAAGVQVVSVQGASALAALLGRQGPGLAGVLFLADAMAAAVLAAAGAALGLYLSARRRRYEYAALAASGVRRATLTRSVVAEQLLVLGFATLIGVGTGLVAVAVALRRVPEFLLEPVAPPLTYSPDPVVLTLILAVLVAGLVITAVAAGVGLVRSVRLDQLREAPS